MLLSLAMNVLLFAAVIFGWRENSVPPVDTRLGLPQANASVTDDGDLSSPVPQLGDRQYLTYQQWIDLLRQEAQAYQNAPRLTVLLGDSITLWFPQELLPGQRTWINQAISGDRADTLVQRLDVLDDAQVETVFLMVGVNDLLTNQSEAQVVGNVRKAVRYLKKHHPDANIVVQSILPHSGEQATWEGRDRLLELPNERIQAVNSALAAMAGEQEVYYLNLFPLFADSEGALRLDLSTDGLHLNERGYLVWRTAIAMLMADAWDNATSK
jgi:lysophospholipase L1-like esterase